MKRLILLLLVLASCSSRSTPDGEGSIVSMQIIDRNGFTETISNKERISAFKGVDFLEPQPYQKVLRIYRQKGENKSHSKITSYHDNGSLSQYLEVADGRAHGLFCEWFDNGQKKIEAHVIEGVADIHELAKATWVFDGECKIWDQEGALSAEFNYEKGALHKPAFYYYASGKVKQVIPYEHGLANGIVESFDEEGLPLETIPYIRGEKAGQATTFWTQDQLKSDEFYQMGRLIRAEYFDPSGASVATVKEGQGKAAQFQDKELASLQTITDGLAEGLVEFFFPTGGLRCSYHIKGGKKDGEEWEYYSRKGQEPLRPKLFLTWVDDQIQGQVKTWYSNGQLQSQRELSSNKKHGSNFAWYKNGDLMLIEEYENDLLIKGSYFKKGEKKAISKIESGKGTASLYTPDGIFWKKVPYEKGKPMLTD